MLTSVAVIKEHVLTTTGMWVPVQDEETAAICKVLEIVKPINVRDMWRRIETQTCKELGKKREETKLKPKQSMSILCNNYNIQFAHLPSSCANL